MLVLKIKKQSSEKHMLVKFCNFACRTRCWWGIKGCTGSDSNRPHNANRPHNDTVGNALMPRLTSAQRNNVIGRL